MAVDRIASSRRRWLFFSNSLGPKALAVLLSIVGHVLLLTYMPTLPLQLGGDASTMSTQQRLGSRIFPVQYLVQTPAAKEMTALGAPAHATQTFPKTAVASEGLNTKHYRPTSEIHTRPAPIRGWIIVKEALPPNTVASLIFTVWVSEKGVIDHYLIEDGTHQPRWVITALSQLKQTPMEPGTLNDNAVPSTMTVELIVDNTH